MLRTPAVRYHEGMQAFEIQRLGEQLLAGEIDLKQMVQAVAEPSATLADTTLDLDRHLRCGYPEVVYGEGKSVETLVQIFERLQEAGLPVLATRVSNEKATALADAFPDAVYNAAGRTFRMGESSRRTEDAVARVAVVTAGTSDRSVAEEASDTLDWMGQRVHRVDDVGVAGPHRLVEHVPELRKMDAIVVVAGMEGALPSVVGGYVACPVVAVPTSVGYGANLGGIAALLGMLNSCAANVTVVNIDAGFKGGYIAGLIAQRTHHDS